MEIQYELLEFYPETGSIQVRFYNDDLPQGVMFSISLPIGGGRYPQGADLDRVIRNHVPTDIFERARTLKAIAPPVEGELGQALRSTSPMEEASEGFIYIRDGKERVFKLEPLLRRYSLDIPVEIF